MRLVEAGGEHSGLGDRGAAEQPPGHTGAQGSKANGLEPGSVSSPPSVLLPALLLPIHTLLCWVRSQVAVGADAPCRWHQQHGGAGGRQANPVWER